MRQFKDWLAQSMLEEKEELERTFEKRGRVCGRIGGGGGACGGGGGVEGTFGTRGDAHASYWGSRPTVYQGRHRSGTSRAMGNSRSSRTCTA